MIGSRRFRLLVALAPLAAFSPATRAAYSEMIATDLFENGVPVQLELVVYAPAGTGPFPTLVFNHGSTSNGGDPAGYKATWTSGNLAHFFNSRGWMVVYPQRRGRGKSGGLYDEGLNASRTGYSCEPARALAGLERAMVDIDQVVQHLQQRDDVDLRQMLIGGHSRGGVISVAYVGTRPGIFTGVVNFMGGWMGDRFCPNGEALNTVAFVRGGSFPGPTLWLYGTADSYFTLGHSQFNFSSFINAGGHGKFHTLFTPAGQNGHFLFGFPTLWETQLTDFVDDIPGPFPAIIASSGAVVARGSSLVLSASVAGEPDAYRWFLNGTPLPDASGAACPITSVEPAGAGLYHVAVTNGATISESAARIVGVLATGRLHGSGSLVQGDIVHPNQNIYDQFLLEGAAASLVADPGQVARISYVDLNDDIVQVEFSGAGTLTLTMDSPGTASPPAHYLQPDVRYVRGHAGIVIAGADETTHVSVFTVGRANAVNQTLFRDDVVYDGIADLAFLAIASRNGRFGGVRTANAHYFATRGFTGLYAPGVAFDGPVYLGNIAAHDSATPVLVVGSAADIAITGGDLLQANARAVHIAGFTRLHFTDGATSHDRALPAQSNRAQFETRGVNVTSRLTID